MIAVELNQARSILCIGAHADDIEIGCGGAILKLLQQNADLNIHWVVLSGAEQRAREAETSARQFLQGAARSKILIKDFRDSFFPFQGEQIKEYFFQLRQDFTPDVIFTHRLEDRHQDHRLVADLTWNTFRQHLILEYEIPKYEGDLGSPNVYVPLSEATCNKKIGTIVNSFASQHDKDWFTEQTFWSLLRIRGIESGAAGSFAEGLYCRKMVL